MSEEDDGCLSYLAIHQILSTKQIQVLLVTVGFLSPISISFNINMCQWHWSLNQLFHGLTNNSLK